VRTSFLTRLLVLASFAAAVVMWLTAPVAAQSSTDWPQFQGGPGHPGFLEDGPAPPFEVVWELETEPGGDRDQFGLSAPIVVGDVVIAVGPEEVVGADVQSGRLLWTVEREFGPSTPPAVAEVGGEQILLFTEGWDDGPPDPLASATPSTTASPSPAEEGEDAEGMNSRLVAVPLGETERLWELDLTEVSRTGVTVDGDIAYVGTNDGTVTAVDLATGEAGWTGDAGGFLQLPLAAGDGVVVASVEGTVEEPFRLVAFGANDGSEAWRYEAAGFVSPPTISEGVVYAAHPTFALSHLVALDAADGTLRWDASLYASPTLFAPALTGDGVVVLDVNGQVFLVDLDGARRWDHAANAFAVRTNPVVVGGSVVVGFGDGDLASFDAGTGNMTWRGSIGASPVRSLAASSDTLIAVRAGSAPSLVGLRTDPEGALTDVESPTIADPASIAVAWALAAIPLTVLLLLFGRALWSRLGPPDFDDSDEVLETSAEDVS
jgi:outer membrane protein assembly factor BamB